MKYQEILFGNITIIEDYSLRVCNDHGLQRYDVDNISGAQVCFMATLWNDECDNWLESSYIDPDCKYISGYIPIELFMGKHEGDIVKLLIRGKKCYLKCCQQDKSNKNFEDALYEVSQSFNGVSPASNFDPALLESDQQLMIVAYHEKYAKSLDLSVKDPTTFRYYRYNCLKGSSQ